MLGKAGSQALPYLALSIAVALMAGCAASSEVAVAASIAELTLGPTVGPTAARISEECHARVADRFQYCEMERLPHNVFRSAEATRFVVADFRPSCEAEADIQVGRVAANEVDRLLRDYLLQVASEHDAAHGARNAGSIEVFRLLCVVRDVAAAREVGNALGADLVMWGDAKCPMRPPQGGPLVSVVNQVSIDAKDSSQVFTGDIRQSGVSREALAVVGGSFCAHAVLTAQGWPSHGSRSANGDERAAMELYQGGLELPQVVAGDALGLTLFVGGLHFFRMEDYQRALLLFRRASEKLRTDSKSAADLLWAMGMTEMAAGRFDNAAAHFSRCDLLAPRGGETWVLCRKEGIQASLLAYDNAAAGKLAEDALLFFRGNRAKQDEADVLKILGDLALGYGTLMRARARYEEALLLYRTLGDRLGEASVLNSLGTAALKEGDLDEAQVRFEDALSRYRALDAKRGEASVIKQQGEVALRKGDLKEARAWYEKSLALYLALGERLGETHVRLGLGEVSMRENELKESRARYEEVLLRFRALGSRNGEAGALLGLGNVASIEHNLKESRVRYEEALGIYRSIGDRVNEAAVLFNLGQNAERGGELMEARARYEESLSLSRVLGERLNEAQLIYNLGYLAEGEGALAEARGRYEEALAIYRALGRQSGKAKMLKRLGDVARRQSHLKDARAHYEEALPLYRVLGDRLSEANSFMGLGDVAQKEDSLKEARAHYEEALSLYRTLGRSQGTAHALLSLGEMALKGGELRNSKERYEEALRIYSASGSHLGEAHSLLGLGEAESALKAFEVADKCFVRARALFEGLQDEQGVARADWRYGVSLAKRGGFDAARLVLARSRQAFVRLDAQVEADLVGRDIRQLSFGGGYVSP